jgi:predicted acyl esterase
MISMSSLFQAAAPQRWVRSGAAFFMLGVAAHAQTAPLTPDIPSKFEAPTASYDYVKREVMIPMRDGVKLYTVIVIPRGAKNAPILITRTPYNAAKRAERFRSPYMLATLPQ